MGNLHTHLRLVVAGSEARLLKASYVRRMIGRLACFEYGMERSGPGIDIDVRIGQIDRRRGSTISRKSHGVTISSTQGTGEQTAKRPHRPRCTQSGHHVIISVHVPVFFPACPRLPSCISLLVLEMCEAKTRED